LVCALVVYTGTVSAQVKIPAAGDAKEPVLALKKDAKARAALEAAEDFIKEKNWADAIHVLQTVLNRPEDAFLERTVRGNGKDMVLWVSARAEAARLIDSLPAAGLDVYEVKYGELAAKRLAEGKEKNKPELLTDVYQHYFRTRAGLEAGELLAAHYLKRGEPVIAIHILTATINRAGDKAAPRLLFYAALAHRQLAEVDRAEPIEKKLFEKIGKDGLDLDGKKLDAEELRKLLKAAKPVIAPPVKDWPMFRGDISRAGSGSGDVPFLDENSNNWTQSMFHQEQTKTWVAQAMKFQQERQQAAVLPAFFPITAHRLDPKTRQSTPTVVFRSYFGVHAADLKTGKLVWEQDFDYSVDNLVNNNRGGNKLVQLQQWLPLYQTGGHLNLLYENSTLGSLSTDGSAVFAIDDLALPPHPVFLQNFMWGGQPNYGALTAAILQSRLFAISVDSGKRLWQLGGGGEKAGDFAETFFLGAPLPVGGKLYALTEKNAELRLVCLNPADGELVWSQTLASVRDPLSRDVGRRLQAVHLAQAGGILVCPTNAGAIFGFDLVKGGLLWAHTYRQERPVQPNQPNPRMVWPAAAAGLVPDWKYSAPCTEDGKVVFTAPDADAIECINLLDGALVWRKQRQEELYVAGVFKGKVVLVGKQTCQALNLADGKQLWSVETGVPSGMGAVSASSFLLPLRAGADSKAPEICVIDLNKGQITSRVRSKRNIVAGNLLFYEGRVISQTAREIVSYPELRGKLKEIDDLLDKNPKDPDGLVKRAELRIWKGQYQPAVEDLLTALGAKPGPITVDQGRRALYEALTELLRADFNAGEKYLDKYEEVSHVEIPPEAVAEERKSLEAEQRRRRANALAILAAGRERQGKVEESLGHYLEFANLGDKEPLIAAPDDSRTQVSPRLWSQARIATMLAKAAPEKRKVLDEVIERRWQEALKKNDVASLRSFVAGFGTATPAARQALPRLAEKLAENNEFAEAELLLLRLRAGKSDTLAAQATERLAVLSLGKGLPEDAAHWYRVLGRDFGTMIVRDKKTGKEILDDAKVDKRLLAFLNGPAETWAGKMQAKEEAGAFQQLKTIYHFEPAGEVPPSLLRNRLAFSLNSNALALVDRLTGEERWNKQLARQNQQHLQYLNWNQFNPNTTPVRFPYLVQGHTAIFSLGLNVYALDLASKAVLWETNLMGNDPLPITQLIPDGHGRLKAMFPDNRTESLGGVLAFTADCVLLQTHAGLSALDPTRGTVLWQKPRFEAANAFSDGENFYVLDAEKDGAGKGQAFRVRDGAAVAIPDFASVHNHRIGTLGRRLVIAEKTEKGDQIVRLYDLFTGKDDWKKEYPTGTVILESEVPNLVGVAEPGEDAKVTIFDALSQKVLYSGVLEGKPLDKVRSIALLADRDRFYVAVNGAQNAQANPWGGPWPALHNGSRGLMVNGRVYAIARQADKTGKHEKWWANVEDQMLILDQFNDLPIVLLASRSQKLMNGGVFQITSTTAIEKRTGKVIYDKKLQNNNTQFHTLDIDQRAGSIELVGYNTKIRFAAKSE
jgi:outer membrane protein assembly factor BamB